MQVHFSQVRGLISPSVILADVRVDQYWTGGHAGSGRPWQTRCTVLNSLDLEFTHHWQYSDVHVPFQLSTIDFSANIDISRIRQLKLDDIRRSYFFVSSLLKWY